MLQHTATKKKFLRFKFWLNVMNHIAEDEIPLSKSVSTVKQHFTIAEMPTGIISVYWEGRIITLCLNTKGTA
jgi:hypothetical protein